MKIIHIGHAPFHPGHPDFGRLERHPGNWVVNHCSAQAGIGMDVELVTSVPGASSYHMDRSRGFPIHFVPGASRFRAATFFYFDSRHLAKFVRSLRPGLVHAHGTEESYALAAEAVGKPGIITAQGCFFLINRELPPSLVSRARIVELTERVALRKARHVIAKSGYIGMKLKEKFPHLVIHEIPNTFDPRILEIPLDRQREPASLAFVGSITERKGVHILAKAMAILNEECAMRGDQKTTLHIFGNRPDNPSPYEQSTISSLQSLLGDRLVLHGTIPALEVVGALSRIELLVAPSLEEMFGNQLIEALLVGAQAVVTDGTAMAENAGWIGTGTVVPQNNPEKLAEAIRSMPESPAPLAGKQKIRQRILDWMGPENVARRHRDVYEEVLGG